MDGHRQCLFSSDRVFRYTLWREWGDMLHKSDKYVAFIGLNPSTADERILDPTCRRCVDYAKQWGYTAFAMLNLFAFRATDPQKMMDEVYPIGPDNDLWLRQVGGHADLLIAAWGTRGKYIDREAVVARMFGDNLMCLRQNSDGSPAHPLYLPKNLKPKPYKIGGS